MNSMIDAEVDREAGAERAPCRASALPNLLTYGRIAAVPVIVACMLVEGPVMRWITFMLFVAAAVSDFLDGYFARARNQRSALGKMLDPIADKLLVAAVLVMLAADGTIAGASLIAAVAILAREILVSGLREFMAGMAVDVPVSWLAKWKTATQLVALAMLIAGDAAEAAVPGALTLGLAALWLAALLTVVTGYDYMKIGIARLIAEDE